MIRDKYHFVDYNRLCIGCLSFNSYGTISESKTYLRNRSSLNKMACFSFTDKDGLPPHRVIETNCSTYINAGVRIWLSPKCRVPRDIFRNSGYKITRDIETADYIIIPEVTYGYPLYYGNFIVFDPHDNTLCIYSVNRQEGLRQQVGFSNPEHDYKTLRDKFEYRGCQVLSESFDKVTVELLPKIEEWKTLLSNTYPQRKYMMELNVPVDYPIEINVETLSLWKRANDREMLAKAICASNWKECPATVLYLLCNEHQAMNNYGGNAFKLVLDQLHYDKYSEADDILENEVIQPKDWNMLQDFLMAELDLPPEGGFVNPDKMQNASEYREIIQRRVAVKPLKISEPMSFNNLTSIVRNT